MKYFFGLLFVLMFSMVAAFGQTTHQEQLWKKKLLHSDNLQRQDFKDSLLHYNLGKLWMQTDNRWVFGFIGKNYRRIRIKILSAKKEAGSGVYEITGKSMVGDSVTSFSGTIKIIAARTYKNIDPGMDSEYSVRKDGFFLAKYYFGEDSSKSNTGAFSGLLATYWYIDKKGQIKYDDINLVADGYCNNQFVGIWKRYHSDLTETCNWGDYRIPFSEELDIGAGDFSPADEYLKYGWESYRKAYDSNDKHAQEIEAKKWWR